VIVVVKRTTVIVLVNVIRAPSAQNQWTEIRMGDFHVLPILKTSKHLTVVAAAKKSSDLVVVAEERHEKLCASVLKDESEIAVAAAFEELDS